MSRNIPRFSKLTPTFLLCVHLLTVVRTDLWAVETERADDPIRAAYGARTALEDSDVQFASELKHLLETLDAVIKRVPQHSLESDFSNEREALLLFIRVLEQLIKECDVVLAAQQSYLAAGRQYASDLSEAGPTFTAAADQCRGYAEAEVYSDARQDYLLMADILDAVSTRCGHLPSELNTQVQAVEELYPYLQNGRQVLVRFRDVLQAIPVLQSFQEFDALDKRLKEYVKSYEKFRGSLHKLYEQLHAIPVTELSSNIVSIEAEAPSFHRRTQTAKHDLQFAIWQTNRDVTSRRLESFEEKLPVASPSVDEDRQLLPPRNILVCAKRETPLLYRQASVREEILVEIGQRLNIGTTNGAVCPVTVMEKLFRDEAKNTQYWYAEIN